MAIVGTFKVEKDPFYQDGVRKGRREERTKAQIAIAKAEKEKTLDMTRELKKEGLAINIIAKTTKLCIEEIEAL